MVHRVIPWSSVSLSEGTGVVHIAPGCGAEDFELSREHGLAVLVPIDEVAPAVEREGADVLNGQVLTDGGKELGKVVDVILDLGPQPCDRITHALRPLTETI